MKRRSTAFLRPVVLTLLMSTCTRGATGDHETPYLIASLVNAIPENGTNETSSVVRTEAIPVQASARPNASPPNWNHYDLLTSRLNPRDQVAHGSTGGIAYVDGCFAHQNLTSNNLITGAYREPSGEYRYPYYTYSYLDSQTSWKVPALAGSKDPDGNRYWYMVHLGGSTNDRSVWISKSQDCNNWYRSNGSGGDEYINTGSSGTPAIGIWNKRLFMAYVSQTNKYGYSIRWKFFDPATRVWTPESVALANSFGKTPLTMAMYRGRLYLVARDNSPDATLYYMTYEGGGWSSPVGIPDTHSAELPGPSIAYNDDDGLLHLVYVQQGTQNIMYTNFDGTAWAPVQQTFLSGGSAMTARYNLAIGKGPHGLILFLDWGGYLHYYAEAL